VFELAAAEWPVLVGRYCELRVLSLDDVWGFTHFPIVAVVAVIGELNAASIAVAEKRGFVFDGRARADETSSAS